MITNPKLCPSDIEELRSLLLELLANEVGTIEGTMKKAVLIERPVEAPANVRGIRCLIQRVPNVLTSMPTGSHGRSMTCEWIVTLTQFDVSEKGLQRFDLAVAKMRSRFPVSRDSVLPNSEKAFPQVRFKLVFEQVVHRSDVD